MPENVFDVLLRAYAIVEVGGVQGSGPQRGRNFEDLFYSVCERRGVHLTERAGSRTLSGRRSASGFGHELDGATRSSEASTVWELKHLTSPLPKNELLIFNGKCLDFLHGGDTLLLNMPQRRFLLSGANVRNECRVFAVQWGITIIEPGRLPFPLIYDSAARGFAENLSRADREAIQYRVPWACRSLQTVVADLASACSTAQSRKRGFNPTRRAHELLDLQEQIGDDLLDSLDDHFPDWLDEIANETWDEVGGW